MKKNKKMFSFEAKKIILNNVFGGAQTCLGNACDVTTAEGTCFGSDHKVTECNSSSGGDTEGGASNGSNIGVHVFSTFQRG